MNTSSLTHDAGHTALPWACRPSDRHDGGIYIGNDSSHAAFVPGYNDHPHNIANAALIVRAVNSHADLVDTVCLLLSVLNDARSDEDVDASSIAGAYLCGDVFSEAIEAATATLSRAKGPSA